MGKEFSQGNNGECRASDIAKQGVPPHWKLTLYVLNQHDLLSDMSGGAKRKTVPAKLDLTEEQKSDIKEAFR